LNAVVHEAFVLRTKFEQFDQVADSGRVVLSQFVERCLRDRHFCLAGNSRESRHQLDVRSVAQLATAHCPTSPSAAICVARFFVGWYCPASNSAHLRTKCGFAMPTRLRNAFVFFAICGCLFADTKPSSIPNTSKNSNSPDAAKASSKKLMSSTKAASSRSKKAVSNWIWVPVHQPSEVPKGAAGFFRKSFDVDYPTSAILEIAADDAFEVTLNSKAVGSGDQWRHFTRFDVTPLIVKGKNTIAIKVVNRHGTSAGLAAKMALGDGRKFVSDGSWKCSALASAKWRLTRFADSKWKSPMVMGPWGSTEPWVVSPLPSARRLPPPTDITKPERAELDDYQDDSKVVLAAFGDVVTPDSTPRKPGGGGLFAPLQKKFPWLNRGNNRNNARAPNAQRNAVPLPRNGTGSTNGVAPREIANPHVQPSNTQVGPTQRHAMVPQPTMKSPELPTPNTTQTPAQLENGRTQTELTDLSNRFTTRDGFAVQQVLDSKKTGSLISSSFNEFGQMLVGRENGPLMVVVDSNNDNILDEVRTYCDKVRNCQGILALSGMVFVVAEGDEGSGLYRLTDGDRDGDLEEATLLVGFDVSSKEHGPHGLVLGPDGKLYISVGNHATPQEKFSQHSPRRHLYEGDLIQKYEDPAGHARGIEVPAGFVLRTDINGKKLELFASGLRNSYDLAFNSEGQLFTYDSDMESDQTTNWYRPTRLYHVVPGSEFGWRSGWSKWPAYYHDVTPPVAETGRGSPTGVVFYQHYTYPKPYRNVAFLGDWSEGRILTAKFEEEGATYKVKTESFIEGTPLNVTDIEIGPDGMLYFVTGGRGTQGGIYRVAWTGRTQAGPKNSGELSKALYAPQINSSWGRQAVAAVKQQMGNLWDSRIENATKDRDLPVEARLQALQLMQWVGPMPDVELLIKLSKDSEPQIRRASSALMSLVEDERLPLRQLELLSDPNPTVRRQACESLVRSHRSVPFEYLAPLLKSKDRFEGWAARRLLALDDPQEWLAEVMNSDDVRLFTQASTVLMTAWPSKDHALVVSQRASELMAAYMADDEFIDLVRMLQITVLRGDIDKALVPQLAKMLADEFPANRHHLMNRELARLLVRLDVTSIKDRYIAYLESDLPENDRIHMVTHLCALDADWTTAEKMLLMSHLRPSSGAGSGVAGYLQNIARDFSKKLDPKENYEFIRDGADNPGAALSAILRLPENLTSDQVQDLVVLDQSISVVDETTKKLKIAIMAVLARDGRDSSMAYIRKIYDDEPARRLEATIALAETPQGENWDYLIRSLPLLEGQNGRDIILKLSTVDKTPKASEPYRQVILIGKRLGDNGGSDAVRLLEHWRGFANSDATPPWNDAIKAWETWYARTYPDAPSPTDTATISSVWDYHKIVRHVGKTNVDQLGDVARGRAVFAKAKCADCHRHGTVGENMGPNLSTVGKRFITKEIVDSIFYPSRVISDQYKAKTIVTDEGQSYTGIIGDGGNGELVVLQLDGAKVRVPKKAVEQTIPSKVSAMPEGLLNDLTLQEITDLMVFLRKTPVEQLSEGQKTSVDR